MCPTDPENWKKIEKRFRNRWNVPHTLGALDGKHIAIMKPKKSGSEYFNYKSYFSLVLFALDGIGYKFLCINVGASGSSSDAQIFNRSNLKRRIENGTLGLPPIEPLGSEGGSTLHSAEERHLCPFALAGQAIQQTTTYQRRENS